MPTLHVHDETTTGDRTGETVLEFMTDRITVRELIRSRVYQEVQDYNLRKTTAPFRGLVQPSPTEQALNKSGSSSPRELDWKRQFAAACEAFAAGRVLILIDEHQAEDLEEAIVIAPGTDVAFLKLVPLVGG